MIARPDGELAPLASPGVDTGMGLERAAAISQGVHSNYETDVFRGIVVAAGRMAGFDDETEMLGNASLRVIADHIRSTAFPDSGRRDAGQRGSRTTSCVASSAARCATGTNWICMNRSSMGSWRRWRQEMGEAYPLIA